MTRIVGFDVSNLNGKATNGKLAASQKMSFGMYKVGQGMLKSSRAFTDTGLDVLAAANDAQIKQYIGLRCRYFFLEAENGQAQAERFAALTQELGEVHFCAHAVDVELQNQSTGPSYRDVVDFFHEWRIIMPQTRCGTYSARWYWSGHLGNPLFLGDWLWDSTYVRGGGDPWQMLKGVIPGDWNQWGGQPSYTLRQFSSNASVGGIAPCDVSVFEGTVQQLQTIWLGQEISGGNDDMKSMWVQDDKGGQWAMSATGLYHIPDPNVRRGLQNRNLLDGTLYDLTKPENKDLLSLFRTTPIATRVD